VPDFTSKGLEEVRGLGGDVDTGEHEDTEEVPRGKEASETQHGMNAERNDEAGLCGNEIAVESLLYVEHAEGLRGGGAARIGLGVKKAVRV
jgi:hypothetical protein